MSDSGTTGSRRRSDTRISASIAAAMLRPITLTARVIGSTSVPQSPAEAGSRLVRGATVPAAREAALEKEA